MKRLIILLSIGMLFPSSLFSYDLVAAIKENKLSALFQSTGSHTGKCVKLSVQSKSNSTLILEVNPGTYLISNDSTTQDHMITDFQILVIPPLAKQEILLNALCCSRHKGCPEEDGQFILAGYKDAATVEMCKLLNKTQQFGYSGQTALWCLIKNGDPNYIDGPDSAITMQLRTFVGNKLGKKFEPYNRTTYSKPAVVVSNKLSIKTTGNHYVREVKQDDKVEWAVYDSTGTAVSDVKKAIVQANRFNKHNVIWDFEIEELNPTEKYYLKILVNGVVQKEWMYYFWG